MSGSRATFESSGFPAPPHLGLTPIPAHLSTRGLLGLGEEGGWSLWFHTPTQAPEGGS